MSKTYVIHPADAILDDVTVIPEVGGLYAFMLKDPDVLAEPLERAGLAMDVMGLGAQPLIYIGASGDSLRRRVRCHLRDDTQNSSFRMSLGALLIDDLALKVKPIPYKGVFGFTKADEARLTAWMAQHLDVGVLPAVRPLEQERRAIIKEDPVLNITGRRAHDAAWQVLLLRRRCLDQTLIDVQPMGQAPGYAACRYDDGRAAGRFGMIRITTSELCALGRISRATVWRRIRAGALPAPIDHGREALFDRDRVCAALANPRPRWRKPSGPTRLVEGLATDRTAAQRVQPSGRWRSDRWDFPEKARNFEQPRPD